MMRYVRLSFAILFCLGSVSSAHAYGSVPAGFVSVYFGGPVALPNGETVVLVMSCVSNEVKTGSYPADVRFETYRSDSGVGQPNTPFGFFVRTLNGPGFADQASHTIGNGSGVVNIFHVRILAAKSIAKGLLCNAYFTDSVTTPSYSTSLPLARRGKLALPKDVAP